MILNDEHIEAVEQEYANQTLRDETAQLTEMLDELAAKRDELDRTIERYTIIRDTLANSIAESDQLELDLPV